MPLQVRFFAFFAAVLALGLYAGGVSLQAQSSSSQSQPTPTTASQSPENQTESYAPLDPLARVRYDNRYDVSLGMAYDHMKAGPMLLQGSNLGGLDGDASFWLTRHFGIQASGRAYVGNSATQPNTPNNVKWGMVKQYFFVGGLEALGAAQQTRRDHGACNVRRRVRRFPEGPTGPAAGKIRLLLQPDCASGDYRRHL